MRRILLVALFATLSACATTESAHNPGTGAPPKTAVAKTKTIVLIHGMFLTPLSWEGWKSYFEKAGYNVYAPAWPLHDAPPQEMRAHHPDPKLGQLRLAEVIAEYRNFIDKLPEKPILIGHSMGGLIAQLLLKEHLGIAAVAIDSAPPNGMLSLKLSFLRSNWDVVSPFADEDQALLPTEEDFHYAFSNCLSDKDAAPVREKYATPESRHVGNDSTEAVGEIDCTKKAEPLLVIAGEEDHIIPASLNFKNFEAYADAPSVTDFKMFPGRCHWIIGQTGWEEVAKYTADWLAKH